MKTLIILAVLLSVGLIGVALFFVVNNNGGTARITPLSQAYNDRVTNGYWTRGSTAPVTLEVYSDFSCSACATEYQIIETALGEVGTNKVQYRFREYPLDVNGPAYLAAEGAEAAGRQGKFWEMYIYLFGHQATWATESPDALANTLTSYAGSLGLNTTQFKDDLTDSGIADQITDDRAAADKLGIQGTPMFLINGKEVTTLPRSAAELVTLLKQAGA